MVKRKSESENGSSGSAHERMDVAKYFLASIVESSKDSIVTINFDSIITSWNKAAEHLYGYPAVEAVGKPLTMLTLPKDLKQTLANAKKIKHGEAVELFETVRLNKDGRELHLEIVLSPVKDGAGQIIGVSTVARDMTDRRRAEEAVHAAHTHTTEILESIRDIFYAVDKDFIFTYVNHKAEEAWERSRTDLIGKHYWTEFPKAVGSAAYQMHLKVMKERQPVHYETISPLLQKWIAVSIYPSEGGGLLVYFHNIQDRKQAEEALRKKEARLAIELADTQQLQSISNLLIEEENIDALYEQILDSAIALMRSDMGSLQVLDPERNELQLLAWKGFHPDAAAYWEKVNTMTGSTCGVALTTGGRLIIPDVKASEFLKDSESLKYYELSGIKAVQSTPLISRDGRVVGMVSTHWRVRHTPGERELRILDVLARQTADLIERKRNQHALRKSEERFRAMFEQASVGIVMKTIEGQLMKPNPGFCQIIGYTREETVQLSLRDITHPDDYENEVKLTRRLIRGKIPGFSMEKRYVRKDGSFIWANITATLVRQMTGEPFYMLAIVEDIQKRKTFEEAIRFQAHLLNTVEQSVIATDLDGRVIYWNQFAERLYGWTGEEAEGRNIIELTTPKIMVDQAGKIMSQLRQGKGWSGEFNVQRRDGAIFSAQVFNSPITDDNGKLIGIIGISVDITERKKTENALRESEERLRLLIESAEDYAIFTMTPDNRIDSWNTGAEKVFGWTESEALGESGEIIFTPEDRAAGAAKQEITTALECGRAPDERYHLRRDGSRFYASGVMSRLKDEDGKLQGFVKICRDMTEQIEAGKTMRDKEMLQILVRAQEDERTRIARDLHDELGQQLTALRLRLDALRKMCDIEELCKVIDETQLIARSIDNGVDFLAWELRPASLDDLGLVAALANYVREWSRHSGVTAELLASSLKKTRFAPEVETNLYRIVQEALNNTHKHAKAKYVEVMLEKRDEMIGLLISDDGRGFNPQDKKNGLKGLGLTGMKERAALVGGTLEIESAKGKGTTIFVRIPASMKRRAANEK